MGGSSAAISERRHPLNKSNTAKQKPDGHVPVFSVSTDFDLRRADPDDQNCTALL